MFGYVSVSYKELTREEQTRYGGVYCGICRRIGAQSSQTARLGLSYDMAFLALLLMSLYEPEDDDSANRCLLHPGHSRVVTDNEFVRYAADMNVALAYYNCLDDWNDDKKQTARALSKALRPSLSRIEAAYPRQCAAIRTCITDLGALERAGCPNPDEPAAVFGMLMAELLVYREDLWAGTLRQMGASLGRFIYLADAAVDYRRDRKKGKYNPFLAAGMKEDPQRWEEYLVLAMARCTAYYEKLPLVQDKALLDNILYSGVWTNFREKGTKARNNV